MSKKDDRDIQTQWTFVVLATLLAFGVSLFANALYDLLSVEWSPRKIALYSFFVLILPLVDIVGYIINNLTKLRKDEGNDHFWYFLKGYLKYRGGKICSFFKKKK